jgi:hypothetical protein
MAILSGFRYRRHRVAQPLKQFWVTLFKLLQLPYQVHHLAVRLRVWKRFVFPHIEKRPDSHAQDVRKLYEFSRRHAVNPALVFLKLLVTDTEPLCELCKCKSFWYPRLAQTPTDAAVCYFIDLEHGAALSVREYRHWSKET